VTVAARHVALIRPGASEAQSDDTFEVDDCFGSELGATEAYKRVLHPVVRQCVDGYNSALLTVGCSGSGKSTILHGRNGDGTTRLAIKALFEALHNKSAQVGTQLSQHKASGGGGQAMEFAVDASFCEVYEERVRDLFAAAAVDQGGSRGKGSSRDGGGGSRDRFLEVEESADDGWHVAGLSFRSASDAGSLQSAYQAALNQRVTGLSEYGHSKHDRAASVLTLRVSQYVPGLPQKDGSFTPAKHLVSSITIADTPGAEPLAMDPAVLRLREGSRLNRAVTSMAGVIRSLANQRREFAGHGDSVLTKVLAEALGGNCATTVLGTLRLGEWERSAAVMDLVASARRAATYPVQCDDAARGLQRRLRSRLLQIDDVRETYREQVQATAADGVDPQNIGLQMAKLHELEGQLLEERGDKAELMAEKEALIERLQRLNGMDKENLQEKESLQAALIQSEEDRLCIANSLVASQIDLNNCQMEAEKTKNEMYARIMELERKVLAEEVRVKGAEQSYADVSGRAGSLSVDNERLKQQLKQTRDELESELSTVRTEHAEVMGEFSAMKARNEDLAEDVSTLQKRLAMEVRRAEEAEAERDDFRANAERDSGTLQKKVEAAERAAEEAIATATATKDRLVAAAQQERDEAVAAARASKEKAVRAAQEERDEEVSKARAARDRAVEDVRVEMKAAVFEARREKDESIAAAHADKASTSAYLENDRDARVSKAERDRDEAVARAQREKEFAIAEAMKERDDAVEEAGASKRREVAAAERARDEAIAKLSSETKRLTQLADEATGRIDGVARALEASKSAEHRARKEADRALGEAAQLKERLETSRAEFSERLKEYMLQIGDLERGAQVLMVDPASEHVLRPSQLSEAAQAIAKDLHRAAAMQVAEYRRETEDLQHRLHAAQRDVRALHAGYRQLRHRFMDVAPETADDEGGAEEEDDANNILGQRRTAAAVPHEDALVAAPPTPAEARDMDARGLAAKLSDLKEENARLQQAVRLAALDGRGPLAPGGGGVVGGGGGSGAGSGAMVGDDVDGGGEPILFFDDGARADAGDAGGAEAAGGVGAADGSHPRGVRSGAGGVAGGPGANNGSDSFNPEARGFGGVGENARLRAENARLQKALDGLKKVRPTTSEEDVRRENGKLKVQLEALANMDKTRAQLANEVADLKTKVAEKETELLESKNHNQRAAFNEQRQAIKEFTERVQAELERENRGLQSRCAMAEEQIKEINTYMAQSTLAYQKEIMRLRSIIQATAPERLKTPVGLGVPAAKRGVGPPGGGGVRKDVAGVGMRASINKGSLSAGGG
jgi:hypothetical protein